MLNTLSPLDNRYFKQSQELSNYFSEFAFYKYRIQVEILWFQFVLQNFYKPEAEKINPPDWEKLKNITSNFNEIEFNLVKEIEKDIIHDVKAIEYYILEKIKNTPFAVHQGLIHFALTSDDVNNLAYSLMVKESWQQILQPCFSDFLSQLIEAAEKWRKNIMLARTHGQPASPSTMGKEIYNFAYRLVRKFSKLKKHTFVAKLNGATGNFHSFKIAFPEADWQNLSKKFIENLGLEQNPATTQIEPYDSLVEFFQSITHINSILIGFCRDIWSYISLDYFLVAKEKNQIGSSVMPHKINPIDFENAEGNLEFSCGILEFFIRKLPISRLQRDLSNSTVLRNIGVALGHHFLALQSLQKATANLKINSSKLDEDLDKHWEILAEPLQTILRKYSVEKAYEKIKNVSQGMKVDAESYRRWVTGFDLPHEEKQKLLALNPQNYIGAAADFDLTVLMKTLES